MRNLRFLLLMLGIGVLCSGCMIARDVVRTNVVEPAEYPTHLEHVALCARAHRLAEKAWKEVQVDSQKGNDDYHKGFISGFADYLQYGGTGEPPPLPPRCYWAQDSLEGRFGALEWFAGFRHGATVAIQTGARDLILVPAFGPGTNGEPGNATGHGPNGTAPSTTVPDPFVPPAPKVLEPKAPK